MGMASGAAALGVDAFGFLISVISLLFVKIPLTTHHRRTSEQPLSLRTFWLELQSGFRELQKSQWLWITILVFASINVAEQGIIAVLMPWLVKIHLGLSSSVYGWVMASSGVGAIVISILYGRRSHWRKRGMISYMAVAMTGFGYLGISSTHQVALIMLLMAVSGAGLMLFGLIWEGSLQELVPEEAYGRVASLDMFGSWALLPIGFLLTGWVSKDWGGVATLMTEAALIVLISLGALLIRSIRGFD